MTRIMWIVGRIKPRFAADPAGAAAEHFAPGHDLYAIALAREVLERQAHYLFTINGITRHTLDGANAERVLALNRNHGSIESCHYILDWNWDEDRCRIRTGYGLQNITRLCRFAIGLIKAKSQDSVAATLQKLHRNTRLVFNYLRMTVNSRGHPRRNATTAGRTN